MNIFVVHRDPRKAARMLCDQHVVKMATECAQMLSTCHRVLDGTMVMAPSNSGKRAVPRYLLDDWRDQILYHAVHINHPCNIWIRENIANYNWLLEHALGLGYEYTRRFFKYHACEKITYALMDVPPKNIPTHTLKKQTFVQAMPDEYKDLDPVKAYRNFYIGSKSKFARWRYTTPPKWYTDATRKSIRSVSTLRSNQESLSY